MIPSYLVKHPQYKRTMEVFKNEGQWEDPIIWPWVSVKLLENGRLQHMFYNNEWTVITEEGEQA